MKKAKNKFKVGIVLILLLLANAFIINAQTQFQKKYLFDGSFDFDFVGLNRLVDQRTNGFVIGVPHEEDGPSCFKCSIRTT